MYTKPDLRDGVLRSLASLEVSSAPYGRQMPPSNQVHDYTALEGELGGRRLRGWGCAEVADGSVQRCGGASCSVGLVTSGVEDLLGCIR